MLWPPGLVPALLPSTGGSHAPRDPPILVQATSANNRRWHPLGPRIPGPWHQAGVGELINGDASGAC